MTLTKPSAAGYLLAATTFLLANTLHAATPVDGTYSPSSLPQIGFQPPSLNNFELDIANDRIVGARGQILLPGCAEFGFSASGVSIDLGSIYAFQGYLGSIITRDGGRYVLTQQVDVDQGGKIMGIQKGSFMGMYADITFQTSTEATMKLYSALTYFTGDDLKTGSCIGQRTYALELAD